MLDRLSHDCSEAQATDMKYQLLICAVAVVGSSALPKGFSNYYTAHRLPTFGSRYLRSTPIAAQTAYSQADYKTSSIPSLNDVVDDAFLGRSEVNRVVADGLEELMKAAVYSSTGIQGLKNVYLAMTAAARHVLETRLANGIHVSEQQFENLRGLDERFSAIFDALRDIFAVNEDPLSSVDEFLNKFELDAVETATFYTRVVPTISQVVHQSTEATTPEGLVDIYDICLVAIREALEHRAGNGRPLTDESRTNLAASERINLLLKRVYVPVVKNQLIVDFIQSLHFNPQEKANFIMTGYYATLDAINKNANASETKLVNDVTLAYLSGARPVINDRLAQGKPVSQEDLYKLERIETLLPMIVGAYAKVNDDARIP